MNSVLAILALLVSAAAAGAAAEPVTFTTEERQLIASLRADESANQDKTNAALANCNAQALGRLLFFDERLSRSGRFSCATCHEPSRNWTDGRAVAQAEGAGIRNTPTLLNVAKRRWYFWDGRADTLWSQALIPMEGSAELASDRSSVVAAALSDRKLASLYRAAFGQPPATLLAAPGAAYSGAKSLSRGHEINVAFSNLGKALAAFESTLLRDDAPFDEFAKSAAAGDSRGSGAISESAKRGLELFIGRGNCILCHTGPEFTDEEFHDDRVPAPAGARDTDSGRLGGLAALLSGEFVASSAYSDDPTGPRAQFTRFQRAREDSRGQFRTPSLRNVALTAPYMHAGQFPTLRAVVEFYSRMPPPHDAVSSQETLLGPLNLSEDEVSDLVSFLESLTGRRVQAGVPGCTAASLSRMRHR